MSDRTLLSKANLESAILFENAKGTLLDKGDFQGFDPLAGLSVVERITLNEDLGKWASLLEGGEPIADEVAFFYEFRNSNGTWQCRAFLFGGRSREADPNERDSVAAAGE